MRSPREQEEDASDEKRPTNAANLSRPVPGADVDNLLLLLLQRWRSVTTATRLLQGTAVREQHQLQRQRGASPAASAVVLPASAADSIPTSSAIGRLRYATIYGGCFGIRVMVDDSR